MSASFVTPLRYPGGKARLGDWLAGLIKHNGIEDGTYIEPYAGGAGAAVFLLLNGHVKEIVINDADPVVYAFWWALKNQMDDLIHLIETVPVNMDTWHRMKEVLTTGDRSNLLELGFATFFLSRTNRSGILSGGVIGGQNQDGKYKIDARYNKKGLIQRVRAFAPYRDNIQVLNMDAMKLVSENNYGTNSLIYLDPPYYNKGSQLYRNYYMPEDHATISEVVEKIQTPWLVTYDACNEIAELYSNMNGVEFSFHYSTHNARPKSTELMFFNGLELHEPPRLKR